MTSGTMRVLLGVAALIGAAHAADTRPAPDLLGGGTLVAYLPLGYVPDAGWRPRAAALRADAEDLARLGARAIVTPLEAAVAWLRRRTGRPVAVRELVASYRAEPRLLGVGDWVFPMAAADPTRGAQEACGVTMAAYR